jgi:plasmid stability protein
MATLLIRRFDDAAKVRLKVRAAQHGRSMEEEAREILSAALSIEEPAGRNFGEQIHRRFAALGGVELEIPEREPIRRPPDFR